MLSGDVIQLHQNCPPRFGICPKTAKSADEILWYTYDIKAAVLIHFVNAWEDEDNHLIRLWTPIWNQFVSDVVTMDDDPASVVRMTEFTFDLKDPKRRIGTRDIENDTTRPTAVDFLVVNQNFVGRKARYAFAGIMKHSHRYWFNFGSSRQERLSRTWSYRWRAYRCTQSRDGGQEE